MYKVLNIVTYLFPTSSPFTLFPSTIVNDPIPGERTQCDLKWLDIHYTLIENTMSHFTHK